MVIRQTTTRRSDQPLRADAFELAGIPGSVTAARDLAVDTLRRWGVGAGPSDRILKSLAAAVDNAVVHACPVATGGGYPGLAGLRCIRIRLLHYASFLVAEVWDPDSPPAGHPHTVPHLLQAPGCGPGEPGMSTVAALSDRWGVRREHHGKTVYALFDLFELPA
jgi:hypothetical protein